MNSDLRRLWRWLGRAQPPLAPLLRAMASGFVATATNVGLLVGALALLVESATRPGLRAVLGVLIVIELLAFLRSPIRFNERLSSHQLGFGAVSRWRHWLVETIGRWNFSRWRSYAAGDLLERSLRDTDELQDLWLRCVIPLVAAASTMLVSDLIIGFLPGRTSWWPFGGELALFQVLGITALLVNLAPQLRAERVLRRTRAAYQATLIELGAVAPELVLLGRSDFIEERSRRAREALRNAETTRWRRRRLSGSVALVMTAASLATLTAQHPRTSAVWMVVVTLLAFSTFEGLSTVRGSLDTAVAISGAAERLEDLDSTLPVGGQLWPCDTALRADDLRLLEGKDFVLNLRSLELQPGQRLALTGSSGSGKSTLLRALAALEHVNEGRIRIGETALDEIRDDELRRHLTYVPSEPGLMRGFALDVVRLGRSSSRDVSNDLAALGISSDATTRWDELSRGERQRVAIVRALVTNPDFYLLDEPTSGLGTEETHAVLDLLASTGASVIVATHDDQVMAWCHSVLQLIDGTVRPLNR
ncbi:MAG: ATP-binding cassette domain-containing protein [Acidimicrobiales bacterium]